MADLETLQAEQDVVAAKLTALAERRRVARATLTSLRNGADARALSLAGQPLATLRSGNDPQIVAQAARIRAAAEALGALDATVAQAETDRTRLADRIDLLRGAAVARAGALVGGLSREMPLVLLPVRIETRFAEGETDDRLTLLLRFFPGASHVQTRLDILDDDERELHDAYLAALGGSAVDVAEARRTLRAATSPERAAWIARFAEGRAPETPAPPPGALSWAEMMPRRWVVRLRGNGRTLVEEISREVSPEATVLASERNLAGDGPMAGWFGDFDRAVDLGMAMRVPLDAKTTAHARKTGIDVIVTGIDHAEDPDAAADRLAATLTGHAYGSGLGLVSGGTPTNAPQAPARAKVAGGNFEALYHPPSLAEAPNCDAARLARSLGSLPDRLAVVAQRQEGGFLSGVADAQAMATLLWPVAQGYAGKELTRIEAPFGHFTRHVASALPVLRIDDMPLGFVVCGAAKQVPATDLGRRVLEQSPFANPEPWRRALEKTPSVPQGLAGPEDFFEMTSMAGVSQAYRMRRIRVSQTRSSAAQGLVSDAAAPFFSKFSWLPAMTATNNAYVWSAGLVRGDGADALPGALYLSALADALEAVLGGGAQSLPPTAVTSPALLYRLARHSAVFLARWAELVGVQLPDRSPLLEAVAAAQGVQPGQIAMANVGTLFDHLGQTIGALQRTQPGVGPALGATAATAANPTLSDDLLAPPIGPLAPVDPSPPNPAGPVSPVLDLPDAILDAILAPVPTTPPDPEPVPADSHDVSPRDRVAEHISAARQLAQVDDETLERLMAETLDLASFRRDAWVASVHHRHLELLRARRPNGAHVGAYGFVLGLKPERPPVPRRGPGRHVGDLATTGGVLAAHTPNQAAALAVVRNAYLTHASDEATADILRLNLDSRRVRQAMSLVEGLRAGDPPGVLFGARFERLLHQRNQARVLTDPALPGLDRRLTDFREAFPQGRSEGAGTLAQVVEGYSLIQAWRELASGTATARADQLDGVLGAVPEDRGDLEAVLDDLDDQVDSVNDLMLFEATYHAVRGDPAAATSALDAHSGLAAPPPLSALATPASGPALTHRIVVPFPAEAATGWVGPTSLRAMLAPELERWLQSMLGDPRRIRWGYTVGGARTVRSLADAEISAVDLVWSAESWARRGTGLEDAEILRWLLGAAEGAAAFAQDFRLVLQRDGLGPDVGADDLTLSDVAEMCLRLGRVIRAARPVEPSDMEASGNDDQDSGGSDVLQTRLANGAAAVRAAALDLETMADLLDAAGPGAVDDAATRRALRAVTLAQFSGAPVPSLAGGENQGILYREGAARLRASANVVTAALTQPEVSDLADLMAALVGRDFPLFEPFDLSATAAAALAASGLGLDGQVSQTERRSWLQQVARVVPEAGDLELALLIGEATTGTDPSIQLAQMPWTDGDAWIGGPLDDAQVNALTATTSLVMPATSALPPSTGFCGVSLGPIIDRIPAARQTVGIALPFDQPSARAPQAILLVVPPDAEAIAALPKDTDPGPWDWEHIRNTLDQVIEETRLRAADPNYLQGLGLALPSVFIPFSPISTVFDNDLVAEAQLAMER